MAFAAFEDAGGRPPAKECWQLLEGGKDKEMDFPLSLQRGRLLCQHLEFSPVKPIVDF